MYHTQTPLYHSLLNHNVMPYAVVHVTTVAWLITGIIYVIFKQLCIFIGSTLETTVLSEVIRAAPVYD